MMHGHLNVKLSLHINLCMPGDPWLGGLFLGLEGCHVCQCAWYNLNVDRFFFI